MRLKLVILCVMVLVALSLSMKTNKFKYKGKRHFHHIWLFAFEPVPSYVPQKVVKPKPKCTVEVESTFSVTGFLTFVVVAVTAVANVIANVNNNNDNNNNNNNQVCFESVMLPNVKVVGRMLSTSLYSSSTGQFEQQQPKRQQRRRDEYGKRKKTGGQSSLHVISQSTPFCMHPVRICRLRRKEKPFPGGQIAYSNGRYSWIFAL